MVIYSHSRLSTFEQCPLKFKYQYIDKVKTEIEDTIEAFLGSRVHEALEKLYKDLKFEKLLTLKELLKFYNDEWKKNWHDAIVIVRQELDKENYRKMGERFLTEYYNRFSPFDQDRTIAIEQRVLIRLEDKQVQGYIDRLSYNGDGVYTIHDYKTAGTLMTQEYADKDRQLALYSIAIYEQYQDCKKVRLVWHYLAFDKDVESRRSKDQLDELKSDILSLIGDIESAKDYPPRMSALCDWCQFRPICPNFKHLYELEKKDVNEYLSDDGVKLVNKYAELQEKIKHSEQELEKVKEALVEYAKKENLGVVYGSDVQATIRHYPRLSFPKKGDPQQQDFFATVKKLGLWDELAVVDVYELAKRMNNGMIADELRKLLDGFAEKGTTTRIYLRKK